MAARKRRERASRNSRRGAVGSASARTPAGAGTDARTRRGLPDWHWRTFPVFAALVTGMLIAFVVNEGSVNPAAYVLQIVALLGVGYCVAHFVVRNVIVAGRLRRRDAIERGETLPEDLEDVVVYSEETASPSSEG